MNRPSASHTAFEPGAAIWMLRIALGVVFLAGGVKLAMPTLFGVTDFEALARSYVDPSTGWIAPYFVQLITDGFGLDIATFLRLQGWFEILLGLAMIVGVFTPMVALMLGIMFWSFTVANPVLGQIRLSRDLALMGCSVAVALSGASFWSIDRWRRMPDRFDARRDLILFILRVSLALTLVISAAFSGGVLSNPLNTTLPTFLVLGLGAGLGAGIQPRWLMAGVCAWLLSVVAVTLYLDGWFPGLDATKREVGILSAAFVYWRAGPDRWAWPRPQTLQCRTVGQLILDYVEEKLDRAQKRAFESHLADCNNCWRFLETYRQTVDLGHSLKDEEIPSEMANRLRSFLRTHMSSC